MVKANEKALTNTDPPARSSFSCSYCQNTGHTEKQCFKKKNSEGKSDDKLAVIFIITEHGFLTKGQSHTFTNNTVIADSGATCHMRGSLEAIFNWKPYGSDIMVENNETMSSVSKGRYKGLVLQMDGTSVDITLKDVLYIPKLMVNLFSLTKAIETKGPALSSKSQIISLILGATEILF
jgi:hypothetical protein